MNFGNHGTDSGFRRPAAKRGGMSARGDDGLSPLDIARRIWGRGSLFLKCAGAVFFAIVVVLFLLTPRYSGHAEILIEAPLGQVANPLDTTPPPFADREKVASEIQVLLSRSLADQAIAALGLAKRAEFNPTLAGGIAARLKRMLLGSGGANAALVANYYENLSVYQVGTSRVIAVEFSSEDPILARDAANKITELYIADQRSGRLDVNARSRDWLLTQIEYLRQRVAQSETTAEEFRTKTGLLEGTAGAQLQAQELGAINTLLSTARAARAEAEARVTTLERALAGANPERMAEGAVEVLQAPLIQQLRASEVQLKREITEMSAELLPTHPNMIRKQAELVDLGVQIQSETQKIITSVREQARFAAARENSLQRDLDQLKTRQGVANRDQVVLRALEREATADRTLLESYLARFAEVSAQGEIAVQDANARIISRAELPEDPSFPQKAPLLALALLIATAFGLGSVMVAEMTDKSVRRASDLEPAAGVPVVAALPHSENPEDDILSQESSPYGEAVLTLTEALAIVPAGKRRGRVVLVTSTVREEGRTATAVALARSLGQRGLRTILIDADLERPSLSRDMGLAHGLGFSDLVAGHAGFKHVIHRDPSSPAHIIASGREYRGTLLASPRLAPILDSLARAYDAVIIDTGPFSRASNAGFLAPVADNCVYAVRANGIDRDRVLSSVRRVVSAGARGGTGIVITG